MKNKYKNKNRYIILYKMSNISQNQVIALTNEEIKNLLENHMSYKHTLVFHELVQSKIRELALDAFTDAKINLLSYENIIEYIGKQTNKIKKKLPKIHELVLSAFDDAQKNILTYDEIAKYVKKIPVNDNCLQKTIRKCIEDNKIIKVETPGEKRIYVGNSFQLV